VGAAQPGGLQIIGPGLERLEIKWRGHSYVRQKEKLSFNHALPADSVTCLRGWQPHPHPGRVRPRQIAGRASGRRRDTPSHS
jgi:hypothetical protein